MKGSTNPVNAIVVRDASLGIEIRGSDDFVRRTQEALAILKEYPKSHVVRTYVRRIVQWRYSGMDAARKLPTCFIGRTWTLVTTLGYAGVILHEAHHSELYHKGAWRILPGLQLTPPWAWKGDEAERYCLRRELDFLEAMGAPEAELLSLKRWIKNPAYRRIPARKRWW